MWVGLGDEIHDRQFTKQFQRWTPEDLSGPDDDDALPD